MNSFSENLKKRMKFAFFYFNSLHKKIFVKYPLMSPRRVSEFTVLLSSLFQSGHQREVSQQVPDAGREQDLCPQHPLQLARDLHAGLHRRLLHQFARLQTVSLDN